MSQLSELTSAGRSDVLPGFILSPFGLADYGACEEEFACRHVRIASRAAVTLPDKDRKELLDAALQDVASGEFNWGRLGFDCAAHSTATLPFLLWTCLRVKHLDMTLEKASSLITDENQHLVHRAILTLMGYPPPAGAGKKPAARSKEKSPPTGTGTASTGSSETAGSPPPKSDDSPATS